MMDRATLHVVRTKKIPIFDQLKIEEALFRADYRNWCFINEGTSPAVVLGISGDITEVSSSCTFPLIRRFSGGGTVVVDEETLFVSFILNGSDCCPTTPQEMMAWTATFLQPVFSPHSLVLEDQDYVLDGKKIGGNAQSFSKGRVVHHTSFLWSWDSERMNVLSLPKRQPGYRKDRSHESFCNKLSNYFESKEHFLNRVQEVLSVAFFCQNVTDRDLQEVMLRPHRATVRLLEKMGKRQEMPISNVLRSYNM